MIKVGRVRMVKVGGVGRGLTNELYISRNINRKLLSLDSRALIPDFEIRKIYLANLR